MHRRLSTHRSNDELLLRVIIQKRQAECLFRIAVEKQLVVEVVGIVSGSQNVHFHRLLLDERCLPGLNSSAVFDGKIHNAQRGCA